MTEEQSIKLVEEVHKLNPSSIVELFELDSTPIGGEDILYFHNGTSGNHYDSVSFKGQVYDPLPIIIKGFDSNNTGVPPRPKMAITNIGGWMSSLILATKDFVGAKVTRRRTFARFLDGMPEAAPIEYPPDVYTVEQKTKENRIVVEFELGCGYDLDGVNFPGRQVMSGTCSWDYRGSGCGFAGQYCVTNKSNFLISGAANFSPVWSQLRQYSAGEHTGFTDSSGVFGVYQALQTALGASQGPTNVSYWKRVQRYRGQYSSATIDYTLGDVIYVERFGKRQFYYCHWTSTPTPNVPAGQMPPNIIYWTADVCSKTQQACRYRHDPESLDKAIPFGAFPGTLNLPAIL